MKTAGRLGTSARRDDGSVIHLARDSSLNIGGAVVRHVSVFGVTFLIAGLLGADALGLYSQAFALRALGVLICLLGMRVAMTYFVASFRADGDSGRVRGAIRIGLGATGVTSAIVAVVTIVLAPALAERFFNDPALITPIRLAAVSLPFAVVMTVALAATQGFKTMRAYSGIGLVFEPATRLILTAAVLAVGFGVDATLVALVASSVTAATLGLRALRKLVDGLGPGEVRLPYRTVSRYAAISWIASSANQGVLWADIVILGAFVVSSEVGIYQVATRAVLLATFAVAPLTASLAPRVADSWRRDDPLEVREQYLTLTSWTWRLSLPILLVLVVFTDQALGLFGSEFLAGRTVVLTMVLGALVETLGAPAAVVLNQVGRNRLNMFFAIGALATDVVLAILLIPRFGIEGAAVAWVVALGVFGFMRLVAVRRIVTGCFPWSTSHLRGVVAALVALVVGSGFSLVVDVQPIIELLIGSLLIGVTYFGVLWRLGLSESDRRVLASFGVSASNVPLLRAGPIRRIRDRRLTAGLRVPTEAVPVAHLISPLRYDIIVRGGLFQLARDHRDLVDRDMDAFIELARASDYYIWFHEIASNVIGIDAADPDALDDGFAKRVRKSMDLLSRYEAIGGFDPKYPMTVRRIGDETTPTGKRFENTRFVPVDGCHRLALLSLDGRVMVDPSEYRLLPDTAPLVDNTPKLMEVLDVSSGEYYRFIGSGFFDDPVGCREDLLMAAAAHGDTVYRDVRAVLAVDERRFDTPSKRIIDAGE